MNRSEVVAQISRAKLVPVVRAPSKDLALSAIDALAEGGVRVFEITLTVPDAPALIEEVRKRYGSLDETSPVIVGAGTVLSAEDAQKCIDAGSQFVVSPGIDDGTIETCQKNDIAVMPGALTPTEVIRAWKAGVDVVKIFPCSALGGAKYLKALKAPLPQVKMMPTGGVSLDTIDEFLAAGAEALGVGANLVDIAAVESGRASALIAKAKQYVEAVRASVDASR